ncbi:MAG TPA: class I SAM-dependent methyltransferase [Verrucomicrobiae bacterium]|nr:class I SAM-dependent methyltransferase [Verrucomicrobiae bacterium]
MINFVQIDATRREELQWVLDRYRDLIAGKDLLEIGSGTGAQLKTLSCICKSAVGIEVADSLYAPHRVMDIRQYDGINIPFPERSFDVIFSSHVLEHIKNEDAIYREMHRVIRPNGVSLNIVPTHTWRLWTSLIHYPTLPTRGLNKLRRMMNGNEQNGGDGSPERRLGQKWLDFLTPPRHGEFGNRISEHWLFHPSAWQRRLESHGWRVVTIEGLGLAYTGHSFLGPRLSMETRRRWSGILGSSTILIVIRQR